MMRQRICITFAFILFEMGISTLYAQSITMKENNSTQTSYQLNKIKKLTFVDGNIRIHFDDNNLTDFLLNNLASINFKDLSSGFNVTTESSTKSFIVYPNPVKDILYFKSPKSNMNIIGKIFIESIDGRILLSTPCNSTQRSLKISTLPSGIYLCGHVSEKSVQKVKFIKK